MTRQSTRRKSALPRRHADPLAPSPERLGHGPIERETRQIQDAFGSPGSPFRALDQLAQMERRGAISRQMVEAATRFREGFDLAHLDPLRATDPARLTLGRGARAADPDLTARALDARRRLHETLAALGGMGSPAGCCVWHVVGLDRSLRDWALREGWSGRPLDQKAASGILIGALGVLVAVYGLG